MATGTLFEVDPRIEVYVAGGQHLLLKQSDLTVTRLSRVFKVSRGNAIIKLFGIR